MSITRYLRRRLDGGGPDEGFSMMEALIAALVLAIAATITATLLVNITGVTRNNGQRSTATNLAATKIERVRQLRAIDIEDGRHETTETVGNTTYKIYQDATYVTSDTASNVCGGTGKLAYKRVVVTVDWPGRGTTQPVRSETLRALGFDANSGGLDSAKGAMAVQVLDHDGQPSAGAQVVLRQGNRNGPVHGDPQTTGADGCVVFTGLSSGNYFSSASLEEGVAVDSSRVDADTGNDVKPTGISKRTLNLAPQATLTVNHTAPAEATVPALPITLNRTEWRAARSFSPAQRCPTGTAHACLAADGRTIGPLYPGHYDLADTSVEVKPGANTVTVELGAVRVTSARPGTVVAQGDGGTITLGTVGAAGPLHVALPPGNWTIQGPGVGTASNVTVAAGQTAEVTL